jgi:hypothetical protein
MSDDTRSVMMRAPITFNIGPVPADLTTHSQLFTFALSHITHLLRARGIEAKIDGKSAIASYDAGDGLASHVVLGARLDDRHYRIQPEGDGHALEISTDKGATYERAGVFNDRAFADAIGDAWVDGRAEARA